MATDIVMHDYSNFQFGQMTENTYLGKKLVPKGYVNLTAMCKGHDKKLNNYTRSDETIQYLKELSADTRISVAKLLVRVSGFPNGDASLYWLSKAF